MFGDIKKRIIDNTFVDEVRINMNFNANEYTKLVFDLRLLSDNIKNENYIDKELALYLYTIPQMIRNTYISLDKRGGKTDLALILEDAWIELDGLVISCLSRDYNKTVI